MSQSPPFSAINCFLLIHRDSGFRYGTPGCNPVKLAVVDVLIAPEQPIPLETINLSIFESVTLTSGQVLSDTVVGAGKYAYNTVYGLSNLINTPIDYGLSFFTDFQFGHTAELYQASTPGERNAMYTMTACTLVYSGYTIVAGAAQTTTVANAATAASSATAANEVRTGLQVFRVFGDDATAFGNPAAGSFTTVNPANVANFRSAAGLPSQYRALCPGRLSQ